jgi:hypothetical protein
MLALPLAHYIENLATSANKTLLNRKSALLAVISSFRS